MLLREREGLSTEIKNWGMEFGFRREGILPVLQKIQKKYRCVSEFAMQEVAKLFNVFPAEIYSIVSFYSFLSVKPKGRYVIRLCRTIACDMAGKNRVAQQLENELGISFGGTTANGEFSLEWVNCLGLCDQGPALLVNERVYTKVTPAKVREIINECRCNFVSTYERKGAL